MPISFCTVLTLASDLLSSMQCHTDKSHVCNIHPCLANRHFQSYNRGQYLWEQALWLMNTWKYAICYILVDLPSAAASYVTTQGLFSTVKEIQRWIYGICEQYCLQPTVKKESQPPFVKFPPLAGGGRWTECNITATPGVGLSRSNSEHSHSGGDERKDLDSR